MYRIISLLNLCAFSIVIGVFIVLITTEKSKRFVSIAARLSLTLMGVAAINCVIIFLSYR